MGGGNTAFEDDPISVWLNPAGTATQPRGASLSTQSFPGYVRDGSVNPPGHFPAQTQLNQPDGIPSHLGLVFPFGSEERPQAVGVCFVSPIFLKMVFDAPDDFVGGNLYSPNVWGTEQAFYRVRLAYGRDFRVRPVGEEGWFSHIAIGLAADVGFTTFDMTDLYRGQSTRDSKTAFGAGFGTLIGVFDNTRSLKINVGMAYQSAIGFDLERRQTLTPRLGPAFNWPDQLQVGTQVFLLEGLPLRLCAELQIVGWRRASLSSTIPGVNAFAETTTYSAGAEYRIPVGESTTLFPRVGLRSFDAPWSSNNRSRMPAYQDWQLSISTRSGRFLIYSGGIGISFVGTSGVVSSIDVSFDIGGDVPGVAASFVIGY
jgi:hypothetical protein